MTTRCGYVALLGRANAGKSTLLNALVGEKIAVVSRKPQTTRNRILGVICRGENQLVFLDTPGIQQQKRKSRLNKNMNRLAAAVAEDADIIFYMVDICVGWNDEDRLFLEDILKRTTAPFAVLASKIDKQKKADALMGLVSIRKGLDELFEEHKIFKTRQIGDYPIKNSAKTPELIEELHNFIAGHLPEGPWLFGEEDLTDLPENFICAELIREQIFRQLKQEVPFGCAVKVTKIEKKKTVVVVEATIIVSEKSHRGIVIGAKGSMLKSIGQEARTWLERHFDNRVFLDIEVEIVEGWTENDQLIAELAYIQNEES